MRKKIGTFLNKGIKMRKKIGTLYMGLIGIIGQLFYFLQAYKIFYTKSAEDLSLPGFGIFCVAAISWLAYGIILKNIPLIAANFLALIGIVLVITGILLYG